MNTETFRQGILVLAFLVVGFLFLGNHFRNQISEQEPLCKNLQMLQYSEAVERSMRGGILMTAKKLDENIGPETTTAEVRSMIHKIIKSFESNK